MGGKPPKPPGVTLRRADSWGWGQNLGKGRKKNFRGGSKKFFFREGSKSGEKKILAKGPKKFFFRGGSQNVPKPPKTRFPPKKNFRQKSPKFFSNFQASPPSPQSSNYSSCRSAPSPPATCS